MEFALQGVFPDGRRSVVPLPASGQILAGHVSSADIVIEDAYVADIHFRIDCNNDVFLISDAESPNGTIINGLRLRQSFLFHGDVVCVGQSFLRLSAMIRGVPAKSILAGPPAAPSLDVVQTSLTSFVKEFCSFAILDGAIDPGVLAFLKEGGAFFQSLYEGEPAAHIAPFGPFLVDLSTSPHLLPHLILRGWGKSWGIYLRSAQTFHEVRHHLRSLLLVDAAGEKALFRFYDPRVLPIFLDTAAAEQCAEFFGLIEAFVLETFRTGELVIFSNSGKKITKSLIA
jgi:hypothetical protein